MEVQGVLDEGDCIHSNSAPGLRGLDRIARPEVGAFDFPDAQVFDVFHTAVELRDDLANEVTNNIWRNPTRPEPSGDLFRAERSWLHGFERVDVLLKARIERRRCLRLLEFRDHIAGEIFISGYPTARGGLKNQPAQRICRIASRLPGQRGDAVEIYTAAFIQAEEQRVFGRGDLREVFVRANCPRMEDRRALPRPLAGRLFQRFQERNDWRSAVEGFQGLVLFVRSIPP